MTEQLEDFFNSKGFKKKTPELDYEQEIEIQSVIDNIIKPAFKMLADKISSYANIKGTITTSKKEITSHRENIELRVNRNMLLVFVYRPKFSLENGNIIITGQYCIPDYYGDDVEFKNTDLSKILSDLDESDILDDFSKTFIEYASIE